MSKGIGLETVGVEAHERGIQVDARMRAGDGLWAIGDVTGIWPLTHMGEYQGDIAASNILGQPREANYEAVPRHLHRPPSGRRRRERGPVQRHRLLLSEVAKTATYTHAYAESNGFLTLLSDGERLTGAYALGPEAGEWLQQATLAIRAQIPLGMLRDTIQPFPSFSEIHAAALKVLLMRDRHGRSDDGGPQAMSDATLPWSAPAAAAEHRTRSCAKVPVVRIIRCRRSGRRFPTKPGVPPATPCTRTPRCSASWRWRWPRRSPSCSTPRCA